MDTKSLSTVGFVILSHAYVAVGILPTRIAFPCIAQCLLGSEISFADDVLLESFMDSISAHELGVVKKAPSEAQKVQTFTQKVQDGLVAIFSRFNARQILPQPQSSSRSSIGQSTSLLVSLQLLFCFCTREYPRNTCRCGQKWA